MQVSLFQSLRFRLIASVVLIEVVMLSIMVWNNVNTIYRTHTDRLNEFAISLVNQFASAAATYMVEVDYASLEEYASSILKHNEVSYVKVFDYQSRAVVTVGEFLGDKPPIADKHPTLVDDGVFDVRADILMVGRLQGHVFIGFSMELMQKTIESARNRSIAIAAAEILLSIFATIALGLYLTRSLRALSEAAASVGEGNFNVVLPVQRNDEVGLTAMAFNKMVDAISERTRSIKEKQDHIQLLLDSTEEAIYGIDLNGVCTFANAACLKILGYKTESELIGKEIHGLIHHSRSDGTLYPKNECKIYLALINESSGHSDDEVNWRADGSSFPVEYWSHPIKREGKVVGAVVTFIDITVRKNIEAELKQHRDNLQQLVEERTAVLEQQATIIDQIHDSVVSTDLDGTVVSWNQGAERLFGYKKEEMIGKKISSVYPQSEHDFLLNEVIAPVRENGEHEVEVRMQKKNGELFFAHLSLSLQYDKSGEVVGMIGYSMDITKSKQAENELRRKARELEAINKELAAFSYSVSHDLRAPLRAINGFSAALADDYADVIDETGKHYLQRICSGADRMALLIDDLLMLSRVTRDEIHWQDVDLTQMAKETVEKLQHDDPHRRVDIDIKPDLKTVGDKRLLQIALDNLLGNAWKYTKKSADPKFSFGMTRENGETIYYIKDNGAGFDMKYANKLFGAFQRLHSSNEFEGTGVGLATVQRIINRHGGRIWAEAEVGRGAAFYFTLNVE
ncbi:PAS domain S-box protein [Kaarinaea lacus]